MKKTNKLDFIFINQYVYQFQNRLQIYEKKNKNKTNKITESLFSTSWSLKKYYCFLLKKKIKKNNFFFKDINLLKENSIYSSNLLILEIENKYKKKIYNKFISKKISEYFLLKQLLLELKIKKYNYSNRLKKNIFITVSYRANLLLLSFLIIKSVLFYFFIYKLSNTINFYIIKHHYKRLYSKLSQVEFSKKPVFKKRMNTKKYLTRLETLTEIDTKNSKIPILGLKSIDTTIKFLFLKKIEKILTITINSTFLKKPNYLINVKKNIKNLNQLSTRCSKFSLLKKTKKPYQIFCSNILFKVSHKDFKKFYKCNFLILKSKINNFAKNLYFNPLNKKKLKLRINDSVLPQYKKLRLIIPFKTFNLPNPIAISLVPSCVSKHKPTLIPKENKLVLEEKTKNRFCFKLFRLSLKEETILISLDKKFAVLKLKYFLFYLVFLKPKYEVDLNQNFLFTSSNYSRQNAINVLLKKLKIKTKYFLHFIIQESNYYFYLKNHVPIKVQNFKDYFFHEIKRKANIYNSNLSPLQLTNLLTKINLNSNLFQYLILIDKETQSIRLGKNSKLISTKILIRTKNINYLFFNILFSGISIKLKHYVLIKNAKRFSLAINSFNNIKNIDNVVKLNLIFLNFTDLNLNSLPEFVWYANQMVILKDDLNLIYECLNIFKKFLYLQGFVLEFSQIKLGHTLRNCNKNVPGFNFLGFFIRQNQYNTNMTFSLSKPHIYKLERTTDFFKNNKADKTHLNNFNSKKLLSNLPDSQTLKINKKQTKFLHLLQISDDYIITSLHPSKNEIKIHMHKLKKIIKNSASLSQENLILKLSTNIRIWSYYYHLISNKKILQYCDYLLFKMLWRWCCRRHPNKNKKWIKYKYFHQINGNKWIFGIYKNSNSQLMSLPNHTDIKLLRF
jgi:hypothetical protein